MNTFNKIPSRVLRYIIILTCATALVILLQTIIEYYYALIIGIILSIICPLALHYSKDWKKRFDKTIQSSSTQSIAILTLFSGCSAVTYWILTLMSSNKDWQGSMSAIAQFSGTAVTGSVAIFAALIAYENNQKIENSKRDRELINDLNKRYFDIISSLSNQPGEIGPTINTAENLGERFHTHAQHDNSLHYFALASLFLDWDKLAESSEIVYHQKKHQKNIILKTILGYERNSSTENKFIIPVLDLILPKIERENLPPTKSKEGEIDLSHLYFNKIMNPPIEGKIFQSVNFSNTYIQSSHFNQSHFYNCDLKTTKIIDSKFAGCIFKNTEFENIKDTTFSNCYFIDTTFKGSSKNITLNNCILISCTFIPSMPRRKMPPGAPNFAISLSSDKVINTNQIVKEIDNCTIFNGMLISNDKTYQLQSEDDLKSLLTL